MSTPAQEEFDRLVASNTHRDTVHPEDRDDDHESQAGSEDLSEEELFRNTQIEAAMRMPTGATDLNLPPLSFDRGHSTGVKGVIADARNYQTARRSRWADRAKTVRRSIFGAPGAQNGGSRSESETDEEAFSGNEGSDEEEFLQQWRETRRRELEGEANRAVRTRRTSPSVRVFGRMDQVDALGYLDAIEKVGRETTVVVFVYDHEV